MDNDQKNMKEQSGTETQFQSGKTCVQMFGESLTDNPRRPHRTRHISRHAWSSIKNAHRAR